MLEHSRPWILSATLMATLLPPSPNPASQPLAPGGLRRAALWGFRLVATSGAPGATVRRLDPSSVAHRAGLRDGDRVVKLNGAALADGLAITAALRAHRAGERARLELEREGKHTIEFVTPPLPYESIPGCEVSYGAVRSSLGYRIRTIVTRPAGARGPLPAILFVPWLSCDRVESPIGPGDGWMRLLHGLAARSGWVIMRVEKPGVGDSEGPECSRNDLEADLEAFRAGLRALRGLEFVDPERIVLFGGSIGGALAPLLAVEQPVAALIVSGTFSRTWFEHMLEIERQRLTLEGRSPAEVNQALRGFAELYAMYLGERLTPGEVLARRPDLAGLWQDAPTGQYGRPAAYFHQVARLNVEAAWEKLSVPVLILYGEFDWIMSRAEHEHIAALVNANGAGLATLEVLPGTDHNLERYATRADAFHGRDGRFDDAVIEKVVSWLGDRLP